MSDPSKTSKLLTDGNLTTGGGIRSLDGFAFDFSAEHMISRIAVDGRGANWVVRAFRSDGSVSAEYIGSGAGDIAVSWTDVFKVALINGGPLTDFYEFEVYGEPVSSQDTTPPNPPTNLTAIAGDAQVGLSWSPDNAADVSSYKLYRDGLLIQEVYEPTFTDTGLTNGTTYAYTVSAIDSAGNESEQSLVATVVPLLVEPPGPPQSLTAQPGARSVTLSWEPPTSGGRVSQYLVYREGLPLGSTEETTWTDTGLEPKNQYTYAVVAMNSAGESPWTEAEVTTTAPGVMDGVTVSLSKLGRSLQEAIGIFLPFFLVAAGLVIARMVLSVGLGWFRQKWRQSEWRTR